MYVNEPIIVSILLVLFSVCFIAVFLIHKYRSKIIEKQKEILKKEHRFQKLLLASIAEVAEKEQEKIRLDLHDDINPLLSVIKLNLTRIERNFENTDQLTELTSDSKKIIDHCTETIRNIARGMNPSSLYKLGLKDGLSELFQSINRSNILSIEWDENSLFPKMEKEKEIHIYRIIQESIQNLMKHASCRNIRLKSLQKKNQLTLEIVHDGKSINQKTADEILLKQKGNGLRSVRARCELLSATIIYESKESLPNITLIIPLNENPY